MSVQIWISKNLIEILFENTGFPSFYFAEQSREQISRIRITWIYEAKQLGYWPDREIFQISLSALLDNIKTFVMTSFMMKTTISPTKQINFPSFLNPKFWFPPSWDFLWLSLFSWAFNWVQPTTKCANIFRNPLSLFYFNF